MCYGCANVDAATRLFVEGFDMLNPMRTSGDRSSGAVLGLPGDVESVASFVFDARGPRTSPAVEVLGWIDPPVVGAPLAEPHHVGAQALGVAVADLEGALARLDALEARVLGRGDGVATVRDPNGVTLDVVESGEVPQGESRMRHLRVTCSELDRSLQWYAGLGFEAVGDVVDIDDGALYGLSGPVRARAARLRLPEEPFELVLIEWQHPAGFGRHYDRANHAGLYRAALRVDDTRAAYEAMSAEGWRFDRPPVLVELTGTPVPDMWITFTSDPDGIPFEFVERPASAFK